GAGGAAAGGGGGGGGGGAARGEAPPRPPPPADPERGDQARDREQRPGADRIGIHPPSAPRRAPRRPLLAQPRDQALARPLLVRDRAPVGFAYLVVPPLIVIHRHPAPSSAPARDRGRASLAS